jgi:Glycosyl transferases group 1
MRTAARRHCQGFDSCPVRDHGPGTIAGVNVAGGARRLIQANRLAADLKWRRLPRFAVRFTATGPARVFYLAPHLAAPSGGVRNIYRHVDTLNALGIEAAVVHAKAGYRCTWFANRTRVVHSDQVTLGPRDLLVIPECYGPGLDGLPGGVRVVLFNQGAYHTFDRIPFATTGPGAPYAGVENLVGLLTVSRDSAALLRFAFPHLDVTVARLVVDGSVFHPGSTPQRRIAYLTHRRPQEREQLLHLLRAHGLPPGWELTAIAGRTEAQTAEILRGSAVFLSFSEREGFGLPPAEAMASGCYVVGYPGMGGREFFEPDYCTPVPDGDLLAFARAVDEALAAHDADPEAFAKLGLTASERILGQYSQEGLREDLSAFYRPLLD